MFLQVCQEFNTTWAWELEQKGYKEMQTECKAAILKVSSLFSSLVSFRTFIFSTLFCQFRQESAGSIYQ